MNSARSVILGSVVLAVALVAMLAWNSAGRRGNDAARDPLLLFCAAGLKPVVESAVREYEATTGIRVQVQYGGSGTLLGNLRVAGAGDLFLAADDFYLEAARSNHVVAETIPLARMKPVIAVARGNPKRIQGIEDLLRSDVGVVLPNPDAAAIGKLTKEALSKQGFWERVAARARTFKPTVNDLANDLKLGSADATVLWDATVKQYPELEAVPGAHFGGSSSDVGIGILTFSRHPQAALRFARFLGAPEHGTKLFQQHGFNAVEGDAWAERPEIVLYSGGVNRLAIEETLRRFEEREGARVTRVYNGCGILTAQIRSGQKPDGYFACDVSFMRAVQDDFRAGLELSETRVVVATAKGNPLGLRTLADLRRPRLKVGVANAQQSALGAITERLLKEHSLFHDVMANVVVQTPTADLLVHQLRAGGLDAAVVYEANGKASENQISMEPVLLPGAIAIQPVAIGRATRHPRLMERLVAALRSAESQTRFTTSGFRWRDTGAP